MMMLNHMFSLFGATGGCPGPSSFTILPTWYQFLPQTSISGHCSPAIHNLTDIWLIVAAVIEILLRIATLAAVVFVLVGGVMYTTSQGSPEQTAKARSTIINALIGLLISVSAALLVGFLAASF